MRPAAHPGHNRLEHREFAAFGIAGARVDRIAAAAGCNKAMIYSYFGSKDGLFDAVFTEHVGSVIEQVPFDATDLPGYAGRLFDRYEDDPATFRLATWYRLERPGSSQLQAVVASNRAKLAKIAQAQRDGIVTDHYTPVEFLALVQSASRTWVATTPELGADAPPDRAQRRRIVVDAVQRLLAPLPAHVPAPQVGVGLAADQDPGAAAAHRYHRRPADHVVAGGPRVLVGAGTARDEEVARVHVAGGYSSRMSPGSRPGTASYELQAPAAPILSFR